MSEVVGFTVGELESSLILVEDSIQYGEYAQVNLHLRELPPETDAENFYQDALDAGFHLSNPQLYYDQGVPTMSFNVRKGSPIWAALIPIIPTIVIAGLVAFGIVQGESISKAIMPILLTAVGGAVLVIALLRQPIGTAATEYARRR